MDEKDNTMTPDENKEDSSVTKDEKKKDKEKKPKKQDQKGGFSSKLAEIRGEFSKIIWIKPKDLFKQTLTVIFVSLMVGVVIFAMDYVFKIGYRGIYDQLSSLITSMKG